MSVRARTTKNPDKESKKDGRGGRKKPYSFTGRNGEEYTLTVLEKKFCDHYLKNGCIGYKSALAVYNVKESTARNYASALLVKPHILAYINVLLDLEGFNDQNVDRQHTFLLNQDADLGSKARALDMYYKRFGKYAPTGIRIIDENSDLDDDALQKEIAKLQKQNESGKPKKGKNDRIVG